MKFTGLHRIVLLFTLLLIFTTAGSGAELPPDAQAAVKRGITAAKENDYLQAIRCFQEARKLAPDAPELYYDLGLAESKVQGRELRAIAWFGAYLAATANPSNAEAVRDQIDALDARCRSNLSLLIQSLPDRLGQTGEKQSDQDFALGVIAGMWAGAGDMTKAMSTYDSIQTPERKSGALSEIALGQLQAGDILGAIKTEESIPNDYFRNYAADAIAKERASSANSPESGPGSRAVGVSDWLSEIDSQLDWLLFIDPATYLATHHSYQPNLFGTYTAAISSYNDTREAVEKIIAEHGRIEKLLRRQEKQPAVQQFLGGPAGSGGQ